MDRSAATSGEAETAGPTSGRLRAEATEFVPSDQLLGRVWAQAALRQAIPEEEARTIFHSRFSTSSIPEDASLSGDDVSPPFSSAHSIILPSSTRSATSVSTQPRRVIHQEPVVRLNHFERINRASDLASRRHRPARRALEPSPHRHRLIPLRPLVLRARHTVRPPADRQARPMAAVSAPSAAPSLLTHPASQPEPSSYLHSSRLRHAQRCSRRSGRSYRPSARCCPAPSKPRPCPAAWPRPRALHRRCPR
jgi:hypothetical protein